MSTPKKVLLGALATILLVAVVGGAYWALACPCAGTPGFALRGEMQDELVTDWSFANDVPLCQVQIWVGWRPHSVNLNCFATPSGDLYLSCSFGDNKYWCPKVGPDEPARVRLDGNVYPVVLNRVRDPATLEAAWEARIEKLQKPEVERVQPGGVSPPPDAQRPDSWWSFHVRSAPNA